MTAFLIDTHTFLWLVTDPRRVPINSRDLLANPDVIRLVSAITGFEIANKHRLGKMPQAAEVLNNWDGALSMLMAIETTLTPAQGRLGGALPWAHRDPFDRLLAAQAIDLKVPLVTCDPVMSTAPGVAILW